MTVHTSRWVTNSTIRRVTITSGWVTIVPLVISRLVLAVTNLIVLLVTHLLVLAVTHILVISITNLLVLAVTHPVVLLVPKYWNAILRYSIKTSVYYKSVTHRRVLILRSSQLRYLLLPTYKCWWPLTQSRRQHRIKSSNI